MNSDSRMNACSQQILQIIEHAGPILHQTGDEEARKPVLRGGWSRKQVIGHLIDSASNNHQRFVRAVLQDSLDFPGYDQDGCVRVQAVQEAPWKDLLALWMSYNRYLAHVISQLPSSDRKSTRLN